MCAGRVFAFFRSAFTLHKLTLRQIARLCDVPLEMCTTAIDLLVRGGFLTTTPDGIFLRRGLMPGSDGVLGPLSLAS